MTLSREIKAKSVAAAGVASATAGVYGLAGWQWAAVAGGSYVLVHGLLLMNVDEPDDGQQPRRRRVIERGRP